MKPPTARPAKGRGSRGPKPKNFHTWVKSRINAGAVAFKVATEEDDRVVKVDPKGGHFKYRQVTATVLDLSPERVEAIGKDEDLLGVWMFEPEPEPADTSGHAHSPEDSENERMLKTFAHLLSDAYKTSLDGIQKVVQTQSQYFTEERKHMANALQTERLRLARLAKVTGRVRVSAASDLEDDEDETEASNEMFAQMMMPMFQKMMQERMGEAMGQAANGAAKEDGK